MLKVLMWLGIALLAVLVLFTVLLELKVLPPTEVLKGDEVPDHYRRTLRELGVLEEGERVLYFYSGGLLSIREDGNLLTDRKVVSYCTEDEEFRVWSAAFHEIEDVQVEGADGWLDDTRVTVMLESGDEILLFLSTEDGRDEDFVKALRSRVR